MTIVSNFMKNGKKIIGVAANYRSLLLLNKKPIPDVPGIFLKPTTSYISEGDNIVIPKGFMINEEVELGVIINTKVKNVSEKDAMDTVGGFCVALDMTATCRLKHARATGGSWTLGKGFDTSTPVGTFIPKNIIPDPHNVCLWSSINEKVVQNGSTQDMVYNIPTLISYISQYITLEPNDLILTGTPPGMSQVKDGDIIKGGIKDIAQIKFNVIELK